MTSFRPDLFFSFWIFAWYIFYIFSTNIHYSPKPALILGIIHNLLLFGLMIYFGSSKKTIFYFILINTLIKIIPLYTLRNESITRKDVYFTGLFFFLFILWIHMNSQTFAGKLKLFHDSLLNKGRAVL
jgi:hypothetical protein